MITIIAEAGVNHNGDLDTAYRLVDAAVSAGADIVKFQTFNASTLVTQHADKAAYQKQTTSRNESQLSMLERLEMDYDMHVQLINYCQTKNIEFLSTAFDAASARLLLHLGQDKWKIPSGEITNLPYLRLIASFGQPIILSTGMADLSEVKQALTILQASGTHKDKITVLHCTTEYPAPFEEVNLAAMRTMRDNLDVPVGYSDHTQGIAIPIAAAALGAVVIEKHLTLDRMMPGPDHMASIEPHEFKDMVCAIRQVETASGNGIKTATTTEQKNKLSIRKSIVASTNINPGETFTPENICTKRPGTGLSPMYWDQIVGSKATRSYVTDDLIQW